MKKAVLRDKLAEIRKQLKNLGKKQEEITEVKPKTKTKTTKKVK